MMDRKIGWRCHFYLMLVAIIVFGPPSYWAFDREPPYVRVAGSILPANPSDCGLPDTAPRGGMLPGACVKVDWTIARERECSPHGRFNVTRRIVDRQGVHPLPSIDSIFGTTFTGNDLLRHFVLPVMSPIGPALYQSSASFDCNGNPFSDEYAFRNPVHRFVAPLVISIPDIPYIVIAP